MFGLTKGYLSIYSGVSKRSFFCWLVFSYNTSIFTPETKRSNPEFNFNKRGYVYVTQRARIKAYCEIATSLQTSGTIDAFTLSGSHLVSHDNQGSLADRAKLGSDRGIVR